MRIISIEAVEKQSNMSKVYLGNNISFCLPKKRVLVLELTEGMDLSEETLEYIMTYEVYQAAKSAAVKHLALKLRTTYEIKQKLKELGYDEDTINKVIKNLIEIAYIDDLEYSNKFISEKTKLKPMSLKMLTMELRSRGIPDDTIQTALEGFNLDEDSIAYGLLEKKYSKYVSFDEKTIQKMRSFLLSRGFNYQQISRAISKFLPDETV